MASGRMLQKRISNSKKMAQLSCDGARLLYTWLLSHLDSNGNFYADSVMINNIVFTRLGKSPRDIQKYIQEMASIGLIILYEIDGDEYLNYPDFFDKQPNIRPDREGKTEIPNHNPESIRTISGSNPSEYKRREEKRIYSQVIDHLNQRSGKEFISRSKGTQRHIDARVNDGFKEEDFITVIDFKVDQWKDDPKMAAYIRPETLFGPKFESYLQEAKTKPIEKPKKNTEWFTCYKSCNGSCPSKWADFQDKPDQSCHWCKKFEAQRGKQ